MGGGDRQGSTVLRTELFSNALEIANLAHDDLNALEYVLAGFCDAFESLSVARENVNSEFFFQLDDCLGYAGLRGVQGFGRLGQIKVAAGCLLNKSELVQIHI
jgi:hypothetical protein